MTEQPYDTRGRDYSKGRTEELEFARHILRALGNSRTVLNVGAGAGSYEPTGRTTIAVEPSTVMIAQRPPGAAAVVRATAEHLPLRDHSFDVALAVLTVHHWTDRRTGYAELRRVARQHVVLTFDPLVQARFWLLENYLPNTARRIIERSPSLEETIAGLDIGNVTPVLVPADCRDGVLPAYWRRPHAYLDPEVRACASGFALAEPGELEHGLARLRSDLRSGDWYRRHAPLLQLTHYDAGFRLLTTAPQQPVRPPPEA